jgi:hypothetical protein
MEGNAPDETGPEFTEETAIESLAAWRPKIQLPGDIPLPGHIIIDPDDDVLPVADAPADPPSIPPSGTTGEPPQAS